MDMKQGSDGKSLDVSFSATEALQHLFVGRLMNDKINVSVKALRQIAKIDPEGKTAGGVIALDALADLEKLDKRIASTRVRCRRER